MGKILLFYRYTHITYPKRILKWQRKLCEHLGLKGRIIIAHEGINGTVGGSLKHIELYKAAVKKYPQFHDIDFKESPGDADCFARLQIVIKDEIVHLGVKDAAKIEHTGIHLTPEQTHKLISNQAEDLVIFDTRNKVEWQIGAYRGAIKPDIKHFRDLPAYIDNHLDQFKDKQVLMYCTGGIRCERATAYLNEKKVAKKIFQIEGGIARYVESYPDGYFRGKNYVFDRRIALPVTEDVLGQCYLCNAPCDDYTNCLNVVCNKHFIACKRCIKTYDNCCNISCKNLIETKQVKKRPPYKKVTIKTSCNEASTKQAA